MKKFRNAALAAMLLAAGYLLVNPADLQSAVSRLKTWSAAETLTASDLNAEFNNVLNNGEDLGWPATKAKDLNGFGIILDSDADTSITADTDDQIDVAVAGADDFQITANKLDVLAGSTLKVTGVVTWSKGADVASATDLLVGIDGNFFDVTGTTTIATIATKGIGTMIGLHFDGALTLTHDAANLIIPGGANITTAAGDVALLYEYASADWRVLSYFKAASLYTTDVVTTRGDIIRGSSTGAAERLAVGTVGQFFTTDGTDVSWGALTAASDTVAGVIEYATQAEQETGTATDRAVVPGRQVNHPGHPKAWGAIDGTGTAAMGENFNLGGTFTDNGTGDYSVTFDTNMSTSAYAVIATCEQLSGPINDLDASVLSKTTSGFRLNTVRGSNNTLTDADCSVMVFGDH